MERVVVWGMGAGVVKPWCELTGLDELAGLHGFGLDWWTFAGLGRGEGWGLQSIKGKSTGERCGGLREGLGPEGKMTRGSSDGLVVTVEEAGVGTASSFGSITRGQALR